MNRNDFLAASMEGQGKCNYIDNGGLKVLLQGG